MFAVVYAYNSRPYVVWISINEVYIDTTTAPFADILVSMQVGDSTYIDYGDRTYLVIRLR